MGTDSDDPWADLGAALREVRRTLWAELEPPFTWAADRLAKGLVWVLARKGDR